jgi:hypothetical protein
MLASGPDGASTATSASTTSLAESTVASFTPESPASGPDAVSEDAEDVSPATSAPTTSSTESAVASFALPSPAPGPGGVSTVTSSSTATSPPDSKAASAWLDPPHIPPPQASPPLHVAPLQHGSPEPPQLVVPSWFPASLPGEPLDVLIDPPQLAARPAATISATIPASACFKWSTPP